MGFECGFTDQSARLCCGSLLVCTVALCPLLPVRRERVRLALALVLGSPQQGCWEGLRPEQLWLLGGGCGCVLAQPGKLGWNIVFLGWDRHGIWSACQEAAVRVAGRAARPG